MPRHKLWGILIGPYLLHYRIVFHCPQARRKPPELQWIARFKFTGHSDRDYWKVFTKSVYATN